MPANSIEPIATREPVWLRQDVVCERPELVWQFHVRTHRIEGPGPLLSHAARAAYGTPLDLGV